MHFSQLERLARELFPGRISQHRHSSIITVALPFLDLTIAKSLFKSVQNEDFFAHRDLFFGGHSRCSKNSVSFQTFSAFNFPPHESQRHLLNFSTPSCDNFSLVTFIPKVFFRITNVCLCWSSNAPHKPSAPRSQRESEAKKSEKNYEKLIELYVARHKK